MVCLGNICRSPLAEGILANKTRNLNLEVDSAGTAAYHIGELPDFRSIEIAKKYNIDLNTSIDVINGSSGRCLMTMERIPKEVITKAYNYGFKLGLMKKDVITALNIIGKDNKMFNNIP